MVLVLSVLSNFSCLAFMSWNFQSLLYNVKISTGDGTSLIFLFYLISTLNFKVQTIIFGNTQQLVSFQITYK